MTCDGSTLGVFIRLVAEIFCALFVAGSFSGVVSEAEKDDVMD